MLNSTENKNILLRLEETVRESYPEYDEFLPDMLFVANIISLANSGDIKKARQQTLKSMELLNLIKGNISEEEAAWFRSVLQMIESALVARGA